MEDNQIIASCLAGKKEAFEKLIKKYQAPLLHLAWRILGDANDARDITQEAFVQAFCHLDRFDPGLSFKNWIYSITYRRCIDRKRRERLHRNLIQKEIKEKILFDPGRDESERIEDSEIFSPVLNKLNTKERVAILLKVNDGYSALEIAGVLGCAESTARVYLFNAKKKLRRLLKGKKYVFAF